MAETAEIHIHELEVVARVGVTENERANRQRLVVNVTVRVRETLRDLDDDITRAADYVAIAAEVQELAGERSYRLIETVADVIARRLVEKFPIARAAVEVRKFVLPQAEYVSVTAVREGK